MKLIPIHELVPGMILAEDIYGKFDLLYSSKGDLLTEKNIDGIVRLGLQSVYIVDHSFVEPHVTTNSTEASPSEASTPATDLTKDYSDVIGVLHDHYADFRLLNKNIVSKIHEPIARLETMASESIALLKLLKKLHAIDGYTLSHSIQVSVLAAIIAYWLGLSSEDQYQLALAGLLHDLGKTKIPIQILNKPSKLTPEEFETMKSHSQHSFEMIKGLPEVTQDITQAVLQHHEKTDGSGYPNGYSEHEIHFYAQILCIADIYAAMTSDKVYNRKVTPLKATEEVFTASFSQKVNAEIANTFLKHVYRLLVGTRVLLNNGAEGEIVYFNKFNPSKPLVKIDDDTFIDLYKHTELYITEIL